MFSRWIPAPNSSKPTCLILIQSVKLAVPLLGLGCFMFRKIQIDASWFGPTWRRWKELADPKFTSTRTWLTFIHLWHNSNR